MSFLEIFKPKSDRGIKTKIPDKITKATYAFFLMQVIAQGLASLISPKFLGIEKIYAVYFFPIFSIIIYGFIYCFYIRKNDNEPRYGGMLYLYYLKYSNVWFYILLIGMISVNIDKNYQRYSLFDYINEKGFEYMIDMFKVFIISILAFLAANIVDQMLNIRDGYIKMTNIGEKFITDLNEAGKKVNDLISINSIIIPIYELQNNIRNSHCEYLENQVDSFIRHMKDYISTLSNLTHDEELRAWNINLLNKYVESNREYLDNFNTIFIPYSELKSVVSKFMKFVLQANFSENLSDNQKYEFYALFAEDPKNFFPSSLDNSLITQKEFVYCKWNFLISKYLSNKSGNNNRGINGMKRVFVCVDDNAYIPNINKIKKTEIESILNSEATLTLDLLISDARRYKEKNHNSNSLEFHQNYLAGLNEFKDKTLSIRELIRMFHPKDSAYTLNLSEKETDKIFTDKTDNFINDFFAIKRFNPIKKDYFWSYCLAAKFRLDLNAIEITIYDEKMQAPNRRTNKTWDDVCNDMNLFFDHKNLKPL